MKELQSNCRRKSFKAIAFRFGLSCTALLSLSILGGTQIHYSHSTTGTTCRLLEEHLHITHSSMCKYSCAFYSCSMITIWLVEVHIYPSTVSYIFGEVPLFGITYRFWTWCITESPICQLHTSLVFTMKTNSIFAHCRRFSRWLSIFWSLTD